MHKSDIATLFALGAALFIAVGDVIQQRSAHEVTEDQVGHVALFLRLLRDKKWWLGSLVAAGGFGPQAAALGFGSVLLVQALLVTSLLFALPLSARFAGRRITRSQWMWAVLLATAVAVIVTVGDPSKGHSRAGLGLWIWVIATLGPLLVLCLLGAAGVVRQTGGRGAARGCGGLVVGAVRRADQGCGGPAGQRDTGAVEDRPSSTRGRWWRWPRPRSSSPRFGPDRWRHRCRR